MQRLERERLISALEDGWAGYVQGYLALPEGERADFLTRQGYDRLADLLAHIIAWWELAREKLAQKQSGVSAAPVSISVDDFNAQAVEDARGVDDQEMIDQFQDQRERMLSLVAELPDEIFTLPDVQQRLYVEIIEHLEEHRLP